jgi:hypothetical protein
LAADPAPLFHAQKGNGLNGCQENGYGAFSDQFKGKMLLG